MKYPFFHGCPFGTRAPGTMLDATTERRLAQCKKSEGGGSGVCPACSLILYKAQTGWNTSILTESNGNVQKQTTRNTSKHLKNTSEHLKTPQIVIKTNQKHLNSYRIKWKRTKTHHLKAHRKHIGTLQNISNRYKNQPETHQNTSNRIEIADFVIDYIATTLKSLQNMYWTISSDCKRPEEILFLL